jgi:hypothetical protein
MCQLVGFNQLLNCARDGSNLGPCFILGVVQLTDDLSHERVGSLLLDLHRVDLSVVPGSQRAVRVVAARTA